MTNIRAVDLLFLDDLFEMSGGYVLNFSDVYWECVAIAKALTEKNFLILTMPAAITRPSSPG